MTEQTPNTPRIFKIGSTIIAEDASTTDLTPEQMRDVLRYQFPEVVHATIRTWTDDTGTQVIEYAPKPGRKG